MCNLQHCLGDFARLLKVHFTSNEGMSNDAPIHECESEINHYTGHYVPYSSRRVCGFFNVPQIYYHVQGLVRRELRFIVLIREDQKVKPFADVIQRQHFLRSYLKALGVTPAGV